jgi:tetratricopeptide (TPR) repeat protein
MSRINQLHDQAMNASDEAYLARRSGNFELALQYSRKAYELEKEAAYQVKEDYSAEPTRSVLFRSAASLAYECGEFREAERLISLALTGDPPSEIIDELRDLLEQVNFSRHLELRNITIDENELQLSLAGNEIGNGWALSEIFVERVKDFERVIYRTVERLLGKPFREHGSTSPDIQSGYNLFLVAPRPGSFTVTLRLGRQMQLPGMDLSEQVIDEIMECFKLISEGNENTLQKRITEEPYFQNFLGLAKRIAPDGEKVSQVGLTTTRNGKEQRVAITRKQKEISTISTKKTEGEKQNFITVMGRLLFADGTKTRGEIQLVDDNGQSYLVVVPEGMMNDIVRPLWDNVVVVTGTKDKKRIFLKEITRAD